MPTGTNGEGLDEQLAPADRTPTESAYDRHMRLNHRMTTNACGNRKHNLIGGAGGRHHFRDALTHGQAALWVKPGDRHAEQAVCNVPTVLQP